MPRTGKGGARSGSQGKSYTNRTDLNTNKTLPVKTVPHQPYGVAQQQQAAQAAVPMAGAPIGQPQSAAGPSLPPAAMPGSATAAAPLPGEGNPLNAMTDRPQQPVTHGSPSGPGAGPEALATGIPMNSSSAMLDSLAKSSSSPELQILADYARSIGQ